MKKKKNPGGRPSDFDKVNLRQLLILCKKGFTDQELAEYFEVHRSTIALWKKEHPEFSDTIKLGKEEADNMVEASLFQNAMDANVTAQIFWLKNRRPGRWREKLEVVDDRFTNLLNHINRKEGNHAQENSHPEKGGSRKGRARQP